MTTRMAMLAAAVMLAAAAPGCGDSSGMTSTGAGGSGAGGSGVGGSGAGGSGAGGSGSDAATTEAGPPPRPAGVVAAGVRWFGRVDTADPAKPRFAWSGTGFVARFSGTGLAMDIVVSGAAQIFKTVIDTQPQAPFTATTGTTTYPLATGLAAGVHTVEVYRQTEGSQGQTQLTALTVTDGTLMDPPAGPDRLIEVIGDSISCGYGNLGALADSDCFKSESHWDTYESIAARALGAEVSTIAASGRGVTRNFGGDATDTMPLVYTRTLTNVVSRTWDFAIQPQAVVINLGTNDISNGKGDPGTAFRDTYVTLLQTVRSKYPAAYIVCMIGPLLNGAELNIIKGYIRAAVEARVAAGDNGVEFFDQIAAQSADKYACQYHPNVAENQIMGDLLAAELQAKVRW